MIIIGEKINGSIPSAAKAIAERDEAYIRELARKQSESGADYLDVNAGTPPDIERETLAWLIGLVQDEVDTPICIDSSNPETILEMIPLVKKPGMINSVSDEANKCERLFPHVASGEWKIIALTCDDRGIPAAPDRKFEIAGAIMKKADSFGIAQDRIFFDALVNTVGTTPLAQVSFTEASRRIKEAFPGVHLTSGLSNISFGMPCRKAINQCFLTLAMNSGLDSAIMDPTNSDMRAALYATQVLLALDEDCVDYLSAYRGGLFGVPKKP
ncbi:MAG: methyltetrahydrofolate cobalamin methyltransferase [Synergistaceae bacterium]|jgi:5-methyltetrahydrofolate--homocysteine methyltransferase|nr:methyltetrahydrofolate cobalamin methyltransferase [Synergistaceae bacterium]